MSTTTKPKKKEHPARPSIPGPCCKTPSNLEWLASVAELDADRIREDIVQEALEKHKRDHLLTPTP